MLKVLKVLETRHPTAHRHRAEPGLSELSELSELCRSLVSEVCRRSVGGQLSELCRSFVGRLSGLSEHLGF